MKIAILFIFICLLASVFYPISTVASDDETDNTSSNVTLSVTVPTLLPSGGGGGGGGPVYSMKMNLFGNNTEGSIGYNGGLLETIKASSPDGNLSFTLPQGCTALGPDGKWLQYLDVDVYENPPDPPQDKHIIGLPYDFQPNGATFTAPPMELTWHYDPETLGDIPEASLVLAYFDDNAGVWVELDCVVDPVTHTIKAKISHFTVFAILGNIPAVKPTSTTTATSTATVITTSSTPTSTATITATSTTAVTPVQTSTNIININTTTTPVTPSMATYWWVVIVVGTLLVITPIILLVRRRRD